MAERRLVSGPTWGRHRKLKLQLETELAFKCIGQKTLVPNTQNEPAAGEQELHTLGLTLSGPVWLRDGRTTFRSWSNIGSALQVDIQTGK